MMMMIMLLDKHKSDEGPFEFVVMTFKSLEPRAHSFLFCPDNICLFKATKAMSEWRKQHKIARHTNLSGDPSSSSLYCCVSCKCSCDGWDFNFNVGNCRVTAEVYSATFASLTLDLAGCSSHFHVENDSGKPQKTIDKLNLECIFIPYG